MPIEPVDPSKKPGGDGTEKYTPQEKRGPGKFDEVLDKAKADRLKPSGGGGGLPKLNRDMSKNMKKGGTVSSASKRADGCCIRGKTRA